MPQQAGRLLLIRIEMSAGTYENLCGFKTTNFNMSANEVDTTTRDCTNPGGPVQKTSIPGIATRTFTGSGKFVSGPKQKILMDHIRATEAFNAEVVVPGDGSYRGSYMVSNFEASGEDEGNMDFSATFNAAGPLAFTPEAVAPVNSLVPSIAGIAKEGVQLKAFPGDWTGNPVFTFQWKKGAANIAGATTDTYTPVTGDVGSAISVVVTATNTTGTANATSGATANVVAA